MLLLGAGGVLSLLADVLCRPLIAALLPAPRVKVSVYRWNPELSGLPCTGYYLSVEPQGENIEAINLGIEFPKPVKDYALAGTWHTVEGGRAMGEIVVRRGPDGCYFALGTREVPPNIAGAMIPVPANKFVLVGTDVRETITGKFIVPEDPRAKDVIISGDYRYSRVGVARKNAFEISIDTMK